MTAEAYQFGLTGQGDLDTMRRSIKFAALGMALVAAGVWSGSKISAAEDKPAKPAVDGKWTGTWGVYNPADQGKSDAEKPKANVYQRAQLKLDCTVEQKDGKWQATFEGECGRPYKYTIKMEGRQVGKAVMFQGTADLGPMDGGVFDWIGKASDNSFVGFYTSQGYTGTFQLARPKP
jgi:hypothetical protein